MSKKELRELQKDLKKRPEQYAEIPLQMQMKIEKGDVILTEQESQKEIKALRKKVDSFCKSRKPNKDNEDRSL